MSTTKMISDSLIALLGALELRTECPPMFGALEREKHTQLTDVYERIINILDDQEDDDLPIGHDDFVEVAQKTIEAYQGIPDIAPIEQYHLDTLQKALNHKCACPPLEMKTVDNTPYCPKCRQLKLPL